MGLVLSGRAFAAAYTALLAAAAVPLCLGDILPLVDYPNHLARMALLAALPDAPTLQQFYALHWRPVPNLAMDLLVPPLLHVMPLAVAGKLFVLLTFALVTGGAAALHRVLWRGWSTWPLLAFLLLYGRVLLWGFLNYLFGVGLCFVALALWIAAAGRGVAVRLALGIALAFALYLAHLMAFGAYAVLLAGWELGQLLRSRQGLRAAAVRFVVAILPLLLPLALLAAIAPTGTSAQITFAKPWRKLDLLFSVFDAYGRGFDVVCFALAVAGVAFAYWRRWLRLAPGLALPLGLLLIVFFLLPSQLASGSGADRRLPLVLALGLLGGSRWTGPAVALRCYLGGALVMLAARVSVVAVSWHASGVVYDRLIAGLDALPSGSRLAVAAPESAANAGAIPLLHLPVLAVARRQAFVPTLFADPLQQPIVLQPPYRRLAAELPPALLWSALVDGRPLGEAARAALHDYDYVVVLDRRPFTLASRQVLIPVLLQPQFQLYRLPPG
jgi:hypothetical protein